MKLILEDNFGNKIKLKEDDIENWIDYSKVFLRALKALEFHSPEDYDEFLDEAYKKLEARIRNLIKS